MNPLGILAGIIALVLAWALVGQVKVGEMRIGKRGPTAIRVRRTDNPALFWGLTVFYGAVILYIGSFAFVE